MRVFRRRRHGFPKKNEPELVARKEKDEKILTSESGGMLRVKQCQPL
jgi:hypothetical protein